MRAPLFASVRQLSLALSCFPPMGGPTPPAGKHVPHRHVHYFLSGALAGTLSRTFIAPYDRVRLLLQLGQAKGFWSAFQSIYVNDGLMGYFRGNGINCVRAFGSKGLLFGFNDSFKVSAAQIMCSAGHLVAMSEERQRTMSGFLAGSLAGSTTQLITYPMDIVRTRITGLYGTTRYKGFFTSCLIMLQQEGPWAFYKGVVPTLWGGVFYEGVKFGTFDMFVEWIEGRQRAGTLPAGLNAAPVAGAMAGIAAICTTYPNDTVRRRIQMAGASEYGRQYSSTCDAYRQLLRQEGLRAFYRGLDSAIIRTVPGTAIQFGIYHGLKRGFAQAATAGQPGA